MGRGKRRHQRALDAAKMDVLRDADLLVLIFSELSSVAQLAQADAVCQERMAQGWQVERGLEAVPCASVPRRRAVRRCRKL